MNKKQLALASMAAILISLTACGNKDKAEKSDAAGISVPAADFSQLPDVKPDWIKSQIINDFDGKGLTDDDFAAALERLKEDGMSWESESGSDGNYTLRNVAFLEENITASEIKVSGLRLLEDNSLFVDTLEFIDLQQPESEFDPAVKIARFAIDLPTNVQIDQMVQAFENHPEFSMFSDGLSEPLPKGFLSFGSGYMEDITFADSDVKMSLDFLGWAEEGKRRASMLMSNLKMESVNSDDNVDIRIDEIFINGIDMDYLEGELVEDPFRSDLFSRQVRSMKIDTMEIKAADVDMKLPELLVWYTEPENGRYYSYFEMPSLTIDAIKGDGPSDFVDTLGTLGYDRLEFAGRTTAVMDEKLDLMEIDHFDISMKDGFSIGMDYKITGGDAMMTGIKKSIARIEAWEEGEGDDDFDGETDMAEAFNLLNIEQFEISFKDDSILDRAFKLAAAEQGGSVAMVRQQAKAAVMMSSLAAESEYQMKLTKSFAESLQGLIDDGGTFKFSMTQDKNYDLGSALMNIFSEELGVFGEEVDLDETLKALNIKFEHQK